MKTFTYRVLFRKEVEGGGGYTAIVPSLPGCVAAGVRRTPQSFI